MLKITVDIHSFPQDKPPQDEYVLCFCKGIMPYVAKYVTYSDEPGYHLEDIKREECPSPDYWLYLDELWESLK